MMEDENMEEETPEVESFEEKVNSTVAECLSKLEAGEFASEGEAIDAMIEKLTAMKEGEGLKGLGAEAEGGFPLPEDEA